ISSGVATGLPQCISADGRWAVSQEGDKQWKLISAEGSQNSVASEGNGVAQDISEDGRWLAYYMNDRAGRRLAQIREISGSRITMEAEYPNVALSMRFSPDGQFCAVA